MKKLKCYLSILLVLSMMLCSTSMFTVNAAQVTETEDVVIDTEANLGGEDELQPMVASNCGGVVYVGYSISPDNFDYPNSTIYYTSNGTASGVVYSIIYTNSFGGTTMRHDLVSYNGSPLGHGNIVGAHTHTYSWWIYNGENRYKETSVAPYGV